MNRNKKIKNIVIAGFLCALGIMIPLVVPKIELGVMTFTVGSHIAIFIAMFISPMMSVIVCLITALGFFITTPIYVALRALSHIIFAVIGAYMLKKMPNIIDTIWQNVGFALFISIIHAACEVIVVIPFFFSNPSQFNNGIVYGALYLVGLGTLVHSMIDYIISNTIWVSLRKAKLVDNC